MLCSAKFFGPSPSVESCCPQRPQHAGKQWETSGKQAGNKRETSVESGGPENPKHTAGQSETSAGQLADACLLPLLPFDVVLLQLGK